MQFSFLFYSPVKDRCVVSNYSLISIGRNINIIGTFVLINKRKLPHATQHEKWVQQPLARNPHLSKMLPLNSNWRLSSQNTEAENETIGLRRVFTSKRMEIQPKIVVCRYINQTNGKSNYGAIIKRHTRPSQSSRRRI